MASGSRTVSGLRDVPSGGANPGDRVGRRALLGGLFVASSLAPILGGCSPSPPLLPIGAALGAGRYNEALRLADEALAVRPGHVELATLWLRAAGMTLLEGDASAELAVRVTSQAKRMGARDQDLAWITLSSAVAMKNDRLAERLVKEYAPIADRSVDCLFALGAARDLYGDPTAAEDFARVAIAGGEFSSTARFRRARTLCFSELWDEAEAELRRAPDGPEAALFRDALGLVRHRTKPTSVTIPMASDLPRSLRPLGYALLSCVDRDLMGIDAALSDVASIGEFRLAARFLEAAGDIAGADHVLQTARRLRPDEVDLGSQRVQILLRSGDWAGASEAAKGGCSGAMDDELAWIAAYEAKDREALEALLRDAELDSILAPIALLLLEGRPTDRAIVDAARSARLSWAEELIVDRALREDATSDDRDLAGGVVASWAHLPPARKARKKRWDELKSGGP